MIQPKDLLGKSVIATATGTDLGSVDHLLFKPGEHRLYGFVIKPRDKNQPAQLLVRENVKAIGSEAITVQNEAQLAVYDADSQARDYMNLGLHGLKILTEDGNQVGQVDSVLLNDDGTINSYETSTGILGLGSKRQIQIADVIAVGGDALVVRTNAANSSEGNGKTGDERGER